MKDIIDGKITTIWKDEDEVFFVSIKDTTIQCQKRNMKCLERT